MKTDLIYTEDCQEGIPERLPDESVDLMATDPPYHLSNTKPLEDRLKKFIRSFNDIKFPNFNKGNIKISKYSQLIRILLKSTNLRRSKSSSIGINSWVSVPECAIDLNCNIRVRQVEIQTNSKSASLGISNGKLVNKRDIEEFEFLGDFIFDFGDSIDFPISDIQGCNLGKFFNGFFTVPVSSISSPGLPSFEGAKSFVLTADDFVKSIRLCDNPFSDPKTSSSVLAEWRTKNSFMLRFDMGGRTAELFSAGGAFESNFSRAFLRPKLIRTFAGTSCLSSMFKSITVGLVLSSGDRTNSFYFHLWLSPSSNISNLYREVKGFMGKSWDKMPSIEIWKECFRVLKPGAFAFVMCIPRQDCLARQIISLEEAGFNVSFSPIFHAFAQGFPKSQNISKAVDKRLGTRRKVIGKNPDHREIGSKEIYRKGATVPEYLTAPSTPQAQALDGSCAGFQPKPAVEVILVAMKPLSEKTYVDQALRNRKGIVWLDDCRIPYQSNKDKGIAKSKNQGNALKNRDKLYGGYGDLDPNWQKQARFPANLLCSDDALNDGKSGRSIGHYSYQLKKSPYDGGWKSLEDKGHLKESNNSFSRYFSLDAWFEKKFKELPKSVQRTFPFLIEPKASKAEKNRGCEELYWEKDNSSFGYHQVDKQRWIWLGKEEERIYQETSKRISLKARGNIHPTVKPLKLFCYLITLGSREGDIILDPFMGSGTTAVAAKMLARHSVGWETGLENVKIAKARLSVLEPLLI